MRRSRGREDRGRRDNSLPELRDEDGILSDVGNLRRAAREHHNPAAGPLTVATTHTQARYALPRVIQAFTKRYPRVELSLRQGDPLLCAEMVVRGEADIAFCSEAARTFEELVTLPCYISSGPKTERGNRPRIRRHLDFRVERCDGPARSHDAGDPVHF